ncbi:toll/interleukin-1 receptor domain-containing protein [Ulvibacter antarcticus]|uniref:TIR domain-containing protein n=1 Tax=Ulvibacter antarcticus TaxID=442714 RepID=A0A3L9YE01_9FLAO|nr:toll/interleukin-1 receptor domain-containing protein [Ulvibacter antarcticus]RMA57279.1 TIR domain-containing protein [Ulvibacter antarcticus]
MVKSVHKRDYDIFLSHASEDKEIADYLENWLTEFAGFDVWYAPRELSGGSLLATDLQKAISRCRSIVLIATDNSVNKGWVVSEYNSAMDEKNNNPDFRVIALRFNNAAVDNLMKGLTWINITSNKLSPENAVAIIKSLYPSEKRPNPKNAKDVYISCSWRTDDNGSANTVVRKLIDTGFRLIGDSEDQDAFGQGNRVERIISSCGAFVSILPFRNVEEARRNESPYKYFLKEIDYALSLNIPTVIISDPRISKIDDQPNMWLPMETNSFELSDEILNAISNLWNEWSLPVNPQYIFCAMDLDYEAKKARSYFRFLIERITGMNTFIGTDINKEPIQLSIIDSIRNSFLTIADITDDNLNTCIEAGIAISSNSNVVLITQGKQRRPPFMLRSLQLKNFDNEVEKIGLIHKILWPYRRRILNAEF